MQGRSQIRHTSISQNQFRWRRRKCRFPRKKPKDTVQTNRATSPAYGWVKKGTNPAIKTTTGRGRVNIHGALNLENFDAPIVAPAMVDGASAVQLLAKIEARNPEKRIIHVIWDNAAYHKGPDVRAFLARKTCRIHLTQLPPYYPHLNPALRHVNTPCAQR